MHNLENLYRSFSINELFWNSAVLDLEMQEIFFSFWTILDVIFLHPGKGGNQFKNVNLQFPVETKIQSNFLMISFCTASWRNLSDGIGQTVQKSVALGVIRNVYLYQKQRASRTI